MEWDHDLSVSDNKIGDVLKAQGHADTALAAYRESNTILKELVASDKSNMDWERDLLASDNKIGTMLGAQGKIGDAFDYFKDGLNITKELIALNPNNPQLQNSLLLVVDGIGSLAYFLTITKEFRKALDAADLAISSAPDQTWIYTNRAHALMFLGRTDEARALYLTHRGEKAHGDKSWETLIRENFAELGKAGLTNPLMDEIERAFAKKH